MSRTAREQAIDWLIRQRDPAFADWEPFTDWLEADPANNEIYAELAAHEEAFGGTAGRPIRSSRTMRPTSTGLLPHDRGPPG